MFLRRSLIVLAVCGLAAGASVAGFYMGGSRQSSKQQSALVRAVSRRIHAKDQSGARLRLSDALADGTISGARLRSHGGVVTVIGTRPASSATTITLPRGATMQLSMRPALAGVSRLEGLIAGLLAILATAALVALAMLRLVPRVLGSGLLRRSDGERAPPLPGPKLDAEYLARHDSLTGLPNRIMLQEEAHTWIMRLGGGAMALILMDLNDFKEVNDTLGHSTGDQVLRQVGERLSAFRVEGTLVARLGGDEFAILRTMTDPVSAEQLAESVSESLRRPFLVSGMTLEIDASMGVAMAPTHAVDYEGLLQCADAAMYTAKQKRTGIAMYTSQEKAESMTKFALASELRNALRHEELRLHFQPKAIVETGEICGVEALVRWQHPERGMISPDTFIKLAERSRLINDLSEWVLRTALRQVLEWRRMGLIMPVSVNLSTRDLQDVRLTDTIESALSEASVPPGMLEIEITESVLAADPDRAHDVVTRIHEIGATTTIDDFGTGHSSLAYLKSLPVHALKIDKSFVLGMTEDERDATIVHAVVDLAHNLGLRVVAEGVEEMAVWERLRISGCDEVQGYVLAHPLPPAQITDWLVRRRQSEKPTAA